MGDPRPSHTTSRHFRRQFSCAGARCLQSAGRATVRATLRPHSVLDAANHGTACTIRSLCHGAIIVVFEDFTGGGAMPDLGAIVHVD
jgi:hypothetical protein